MSSANNTYSTTRDMTLLKSILDAPGGAGGTPGTSTEYTGDTAHLHLPPAPPRPRTSRGREDLTIPEEDEGGDNRGISEVKVVRRYSNGDQEETVDGWRRRGGSGDHSSGRSDNPRRRRTVRRARRIRYVYVEPMVDRLEEKYEELRSLVTNHGRSALRRRRYDDGLARQAREMIYMHDMRSRGAVPVMRDPLNSRSARPQSAHAALTTTPRSALRNTDTGGGGDMYGDDKRQRQCHRAVTWLDLDNRGTQTVGRMRKTGAVPTLEDTDPGLVLPTGGTLGQNDSDEYILIDATNTRDIQTRIVEYDQMDYGLTSRNRTIGLTMDAKPKISRRPKSAKARLGNPKDRVFIRNFASKAPSREQESNSVNKRNSSTAKDVSDDSESENCENRSGSRERSDHQLKNTDNEKIQTWLKKKNKLLRAQKGEERKEKRKKVKEDKEEKKKKEEIKVKSEEKVAQWMKQKKQEQRMLEKRQRENSSDMSRGTSNSTIYNNELENVETVVGQQNKDSNKDENSKANTKPKRVAMRPTVCTYQFTNPMIARPKTQSAKSQRPKSGKPRNTDKQNETDKDKKLLNADDWKSYEAWLKSRESEKGKQNGTKESPVDVSTEELITDIGQRRMSAVLEQQAKETDSEGKLETAVISVNNTSCSSNATTPRPESPVEAARPTSAVVPKASKSPNRSSNERSSSTTPIPDAPTPRPKTPTSPAYNKVKREQKTWENFADHVWKQVNDEERPEPQGSDNPDDQVSSCTPKTQDTENFEEKSDKTQPEKDTQASTPDKKLSGTLTEEEMRSQVHSAMEEVLERSKTRMGSRSNSESSSPERTGSIASKHSSRTGSGRNSNANSKKNSRQNSQANSRHSSKQSSKANSRRSSKSDSRKSSRSSSRRSSNSSGSSHSSYASSSLPSTRSATSTNGKEQAKEVKDQTGTVHENSKVADENDAHEPASHQEEENTIQANEEAAASIDVPLVSSNTGIKVTIESATPLDNVSMAEQNSPAVDESPIDNGPSEQSKKEEDAVENMDETNSKSSTIDQDETKSTASEEGDGEKTLTRDKVDENQASDSEKKDQDSEQAPNGHGTTPDNDDPAKDKSGIVSPNDERTKPVDQAENTSQQGESSEQDNNKVDEKFTTETD